MLTIKRTAQAEFHITTGHLPEKERADATAALISAAHEEFPGLRFSAPCVWWSTWATLTVTAPADVPDIAFERLVGWGHGSLTLELVK